MRRPSANAQRREAYNADRAAGRCTKCGNASPRYAACMECRRYRVELKEKPTRKPIKDNTAAILRLYCHDLAPAPHVAKKLRRTQSYVYDRVFAAQVHRAPGVGIQPQCVPWIAEAAELAVTTSYRKLGARFGVDSSSLQKALNRYREASQEWVVEALAMHRAERSWADIAATLQRDVDDVRIFVSRRAAYVRHKQEMIR